MVSNVLPGSGLLCLHRSLDCSQSHGPWPAVKDIILAPWTEFMMEEVEPLLLVPGEPGFSEAASESLGLRQPLHSLSGPMSGPAVLNLMFLEIAGSTSVAFHQLRVCAEIKLTALLSFQSPV